MNRDLKKVIKGINKTYGEEVMRTLGDKRNANVDGISTGALPLDLALGGNGIPKGRVCEFYGPESSGKTTLALSVAGEVQKAGGTVAYIDAEHALDPVWASKLGVNINDMIINQPEYAEQALDIVEQLTHSGQVDLIVVDSVAALVPKVELEGEMGQAHVGLMARLMSQALRKITAALYHTNTTIIFINQIRYKIGVMFGNPETTPGGNALKFYSSVRLDIRRKEQLKSSDGFVVGNKVKVKVVKNKVAAPFQTCEFDLLYYKGIDKEGCIIDVAAGMGIISQNGSWFTFGEEKFQGKYNVVLHLERNPELAAKLELDCINMYRENNDGKES